MRPFRFAAAGGLLLSLLAGPAAAQLKCSDIEFASVVTDRFPEISSACREVVARDGSEFVQIRADVVSVRRNVRNPSVVQMVTLRALDAQDQALREFAFRPDRNFSYTVDGEKRTADSMGRGQKLTIYVPSDRWEMVWDLSTAIPFEERIFVEDVESMTSVVTLQADEAFGFDSDALSDAGKAQLDALLGQSGDFVPLIDIAGYTDRIGAEDYNLDLSKRRAEAARTYLVSKGVPENRVRAMGKGSAEPIVSCDTKTGDALVDCLAPNRRAEVSFMIPLVGEAGLVEVTKRYRKPNGQIVEVVEFNEVIGVSSASSLFGEILDGCADEIRDNCSDVAAGDGRLLYCLYENAGHLGEACVDSLEETSITLSRRQQQLNIIGDACANDMAASCSLVPVVDKLDCLRGAAREQSCKDAVAQFRSIR